MSVSGANVTETTISSLIPSTNYFIEVAAVNRAGIGVYSTSLVVETPYSGRLIILYYSYSSLEFMHDIVFPEFRCISQSEWQYHS